MCKVLTLFIATLTSLVFQAFAMDDNIEKDLKKQPCQYIQKLLKLKHKQEELFYQNKFEALEEITCEIGALLTFKDYLNNPNITYRKATQAEAQIILSVVAQNRRIYKGTGNMMERFYMFDNAQGKEKIKQDLNYAKHIASLAWADSIAHQVFNNVSFHPSKDDDKDFYDWLSEQRKKNNIDQNFKDYILNAKDIFNKPIHPDYIQDQIQNLSDENWNNLTKNLGLVLDIFAPELDILDLSEGTKITDGNYKGWEVHGVDALGAFGHNQKIYGNFPQHKLINAILADLSKNKHLCGKSKDLVLYTSFSAVQLSKEFVKTNTQDIDYQNTVNKFIDKNLLVLECIVHWFYHDIPQIFLGSNERLEKTFRVFFTKPIHKNLNTNVLSKFTMEDINKRIDNYERRTKSMSYLEQLYDHYEIVDTELESAKDGADKGSAFCMQDYVNKQEYYGKNPDTSYRNLGIDLGGYVLRMEDLPISNRFLRRKMKLEKEVHKLAPYLYKALHRVNLERASAELKLNSLYLTEKQQKQKEYIALEGTKYKLTEEENATVANNFISYVNAIKQNTVRIWPELFQ